MRAAMRLPLFVVVVALGLSGCGQKPGPLVIEPDAELGPPGVKADPPAGPFNGEITITFETPRPATIYFSTNGQDPRTSTVGRVSGPSPQTLKVSANTTVKYFASANGKDGELSEGTWTRAGGPRGTISGVVVVGGFAVGKEVGLFRNTSLQQSRQAVHAHGDPLLLHGPDDRAAPADRDLGSQR